MIYTTGKQLEEAYEQKTGKPWPFLISGQDMLDMADPGFAKFMHGIVGPTIKKIAKHYDNSQAQSRPARVRP